jgi:hypothetical protein
MGDVEDPELYAAAPIIEWEKSEKGQWLHEHSRQQMEYISVLIRNLWLDGVNICVVRRTRHNLLSIKMGRMIWHMMY